MRIQVNGTELYYEKTGKGEPLLLVHGNGQDHTLFDRALPVLEEHFTCYAIDSRGHGQSAPTDRLDYDRMAQDVLALLEKLDLRGVHYFGHSDGGIIGLIAASQTDRLKTLIVTGANTHPLGLKKKKLLKYAGRYLRTRDPKVRMILTEPHIHSRDLARISVPTLVLAGENDLITERHTRRLARSIPGAALRILSGETHGSYVGHSEKIAFLIRDFILQEA